MTWQVTGKITYKHEKAIEVAHKIGKHVPRSRGLGDLLIVSDLPDKTVLMNHQNCCAKIIPIDDFIDYIVQNHPEELL